MSGGAVMSGLVMLCLLLLQTGGALGFKIWRTDILSHEGITERAILNITVQVCQAVARAAGKDFTFPSQPFTARSVATACGAPQSLKGFREAISLIQTNNRRVDINHFFQGRYHFDGEEFTAGKKIITRGLEVVKASNRRQNYETAREKLGQILHTLQDFYSHSNWVEMENNSPYSKLLDPGIDVENVAAKSRATCRSCDGSDCKNNILEDILKEKILTSGYFSPFSPLKPDGKCSHGNSGDATSLIAPTGGINKDTPTSSHGHLHTQAANLAIAATSELLQDIWGAAGDDRFLQMIGITKGKALCFAIDTTGSMMDDINAVKNVSSFIINSKVGTADEPSIYILVPFNDPDFGPVYKTTNPNDFKNLINSLTASGGGDYPEMSLSGLELALTNAPPNSEIFVFTDAPAKDIELKGTVIALIEQTKTVVNFMITGFLGSSRRRRDVGNDPQQQQRGWMVRSEAQLYRDLAQASGGQAIQVTKNELLTAAINIVTESSTSSLVTLLLASRSAGNAESFTFSVDESVKDPTIYITGSSVSFTLINPSGVPQNISNTSESSIIKYQSVGNLRTLWLQTQVGQWEIKIVSSQAYTLKVIGKSPIDFLYDFLDATQGPLGELDVIDYRPTSGANGTLRVTVTGSDSLTLTEVHLVETSGSGVVNSSVEAQGSGTFLARFDKIPSVDFVVLVKGQNSNTNSKASSVNFQRQSPTSIRASALTVTTAGADSVLVPGTPLSVPFSVTTSGAGGNFSIQANNDKGFNSTFPSSLILEAGGSANATIDLTAPLNTVSGTDVTLTIVARAPGASDSNYAVLRLTVLGTVTDFSEPVCKLLSLKSSCSDNCNSTWELSVQVTDGENGTGVSRISLAQGNGTLNTSIGTGSENTTLVSYTASCCSPDAELLVVDQVGNVGSCFYSARATEVTTTSKPPTPTAAPLVSLSSRADQSLLLCFIFTLTGIKLQSQVFG
ncbi:von Willebrand factor A domain-containing protein 7-like [Parambassis ranga]|uniref:von Willebrand factor A domain-containing protein 7-like n=1 Tax=Parambassis ranga TaxID=210632 RepID=A0A6P7JK33_9TELE|nr:von Willebrand factor A domain-containing protein 7-like [Parambassis ranga]XP_028277319.1 von Willebrand factor A domain-containing protein 7-like [Parambassis ranga]